MLFLFAHGIKMKIEIEIDQTFFIIVEKAFW